MWLKVMKKNTMLMYRLPKPFLLATEGHSPGCVAFLLTRELEVGAAGGPLRWFTSTAVARARGSQTMERSSTPTLNPSPGTTCHAALPVQGGASLSVRWCTVAALAPRLQPRVL